MIDDVTRKKRILTTIAAWNDRRFDLVAEWFDDSVVLCTPYREAVDGEQGDIHGKSNVIAYFGRAIPDIPVRFALHDILLGNGWTTIVLYSDSGAVAWTVEETPEGKAKKIIATYGVGASYGDQAV